MNENNHHYENINIMLFTKILINKNDKNNLFYNSIFTITII